VQDGVVGGGGVEFGEAVDFGEVFTAAGGEVEVQGLGELCVALAFYRCADSRLSYGSERVLTT
jgi:hypothetical protein